MFLMMWFYTCVVLEKVDPLQGGYFRRRYRTDRRPTFKRELPVLFHLRFAAEVAWKHMRLAGQLWQLYGLRRKLKHDPAAREYTDAALTPVTEGEVESLEMFKVMAG